MNTETNAGQGNVDGMKSKLMRDIRTVAGDGEALLRGVAGSATQDFSDAIASVEGRLDGARTAVTDRARGAANATQNYVVGHPWTVIGVVAGVGLLIGALFSRR